jgi:small-conductance mechanosensitive channel
MDIKQQHKGDQRPAKIPRVNSSAAHHWFIGSYILFAVISICCYFLFRLHFFGFSSVAAKWLPKIAMTCFCIALLLIVSRIVQRAVTRSAHGKVAAYNVIRAIRLVTTLLAALMVISFLNANWYAAAASLGIVSLILGFALQTPIVSLIGWVYIVIRSPYKVGDRIQVSNFTGDVVEISYLDTTLWEFAGDYLSNDVPSGRLIRFPNSLVFQDQVYNYSWNKFPYIWNEIPFHVAYESDLLFIEDSIKKIATEELGEGMLERVRELRAMISQTPVDELEVKEFPFVNFRINANTWVEVLLIYLVEPKQSGAVRSRLIKRILDELGRSPDKVMFPKTNAR